MKNIAICVIAYNRIDSLRRVIQSLDVAFYPHSVELIISIDKSNSTVVRDYAENLTWEHGSKRVIAHKENLGLRKHVLACGDLLDEYDALVVLEDDVSVAQSFFLYAEQCVDKYWDDQQIAGISLYNFPLCYHNRLPFIPLHSDSDVFLQQTAQSWGQVWMKKQWKEFRKWYDQNNEEFPLLPHLPKSICSWPKSSWLKYHSRYCIEENKYFVYPYCSLSTNNCDAGTHAEASTIFQSPLLYGCQEHFNLNPTIKYDGFFENEILYDILSLNEDELCIDFYGEKGNRIGKKYWLTRETLPYKVVASYSLSLKPYELNVLYKRKGTGFFLYDTTVKDAKVDSLSVRQTYEYAYGLNFGVKTTSRLLGEVVKDKIIKKLSCISWH